MGGGNDDGREALTVLNLEGSDGAHSYNEHFRDFAKYKRNWETVCNRFVLAKSESIIDALEDKAKIISWRHTDSVCAMMQLKPLSQENLYLLPESCRTDFDLNDERMYHWDIQLSDDDDFMSGDVDVEQDVIFCDEEREILQSLSSQKN